jgi:hypothetical protein
VAVGGTDNTAGPRVDELSGFLELAGDRAAETLWLAALSMIERAVAEAREGKWSRFRAFPRGELRRLRRDLAEALLMARLAAAVQIDDNELTRELMRPLREAAEREGAERRRAGTREAERVRLENARKRRRGS